MSKLYPPHIEGKIRAQSGRELSIPFRPSRAVGEADYTGMRLVLKSVSTGAIIKNTPVTIPKDQIENNTFIWQNIPTGTLTEGRYYKAQLAYMNGNEEGYYSSVGVFKYTTSIESNEKNENCIFIDNFDGTHKSQYVGVYRHNDISEKAYSYCFSIYKDNGEVFLTSGTQIHNVNEDTSSTESRDIWYINQPLEKDKTYSIEYIVETVSGHICRTGKLPLRPQLSAADDGINRLHMGLIMENDFDNGLIKLLYKPENKNIENPSVTNGNFIISRASSKDGYDTWIDLYQFTEIDKKKPLIYTDYTVEQGVSYRYALQQYGLHEPGSQTLLFSDRVLFIANENGVWSDEIVADFEDMFLHDGERQLRIRLNPKVSSFKTTILETKTDTIGGKHPYFFRNGDVKYQEMSISGLISHVVDNEEMFMSKADLGYAGLRAGVRSDTEAHEDMRAAAASYEPYADTGLSTTNFAVERFFKTEVLSWLTNGQPKLLRTAAEGNFIVRLMNTSMTPNDQLSRMLHTFTSTAYEIAEYNTENLIKYGIIAEQQYETNVSFTPKSVASKTSTGRITAKTSGDIIPDIEKKVGVNSRVLLGEWTSLSLSYDPKVVANPVIKIKYHNEPQKTIYDITKIESGKMIDYLYVSKDIAVSFTVTYKKV